MLFFGRPQGLPAVPCLFVMVAVLSAGAVDAYKNYTVGEGKGWYDGGAVDYQAWADGYNFSLGDFLIFNTDKNHSVVQTRNETLYKSCDYENSGPDDTVDWSAAAPEFSKDAVTAAVPLLKEGDTYFFSGNYDGEQCMGGQRFTIAVAHGQGLPPDLRPPTADASGPAPGPEAEGIADAVPAFDFSHPKNVSTPSLDKDASDDETHSDTSGASLTLACLGPGLVMVLAALFAVQV